MNKYISSLLLIFVIVLFPEKTFAQLSAGAQITVNIPGNCLIDTNGAPVNMTLPTTVAGAPLPTVSNSDMYIRLSAVNPGGTYRLVTARISGGAVPAGTRLTLGAALSTNSNGAGNIGRVLPPIVLNSTDQVIVRGIGSCYTGTGFTDGYRLTYTWGPYGPLTDYGLINATVVPSTLTIMLTISAPDGNNI